MPITSMMSANIMKSIAKFGFISISLLKPPIEPSFAMTLWQEMIAMGFLPLTFPTALLANS